MTDVEQEMTPAEFLADKMRNMLNGMDDDTGTLDAPFGMDEGCAAFLVVFNNKVYSVSITPEEGIGVGNTDAG